MTLTAGTKLGRYEIDSQLGKGGMGEVYLAHDTTLNRKVALKVLPAELAANQDRMRRFEQEAKAAAALNHPNVAHVYEIGESEGLHFIAMEYVEGKTLREKIHYQQVELRKLLKYLQQVAGGLAKAHAVGIVHRDLKPDNVMISDDGYAKILDFGLAKLIEIPTPGPDGETTSDAQTVAQMQYSVPGRLLGTVGYMSPEQAQGKTGEIDHRSDVFSFGCMLYESVTRQRPFQGESNVASLYKIVYEPARNITEFDPSAPAELQRIIRRCLAKDPEDRYQTIQDVAIELRDLRRELEGDAYLDVTIAPSAIGGRGVGNKGMLPHSESTIGGSQTIASGTAEATGVTNETAPAVTTSSSEVILGEIGKHKKAVVLTLVCILLAVVAVIFLWGKVVGPPRTEPFRSMRITPLTTGGKIGNASIKGYTSISPDGKYVVFRTTEAGKDSLWVRQISSGSMVKIVPDVEGKIGGTTFSRDGELVYYSQFVKDDSLGTLYQVPVLGATPRRVMAGVTSPITFSPDGSQFAFVRATPSESVLMSANLEGTSEQRIASRSLPNYFAFGGGPSWSPDGKKIACGAGSFSGSQSATIVAVPAGGGVEEPLTSQTWVSVSRVLWMSDGSGLIVAAIPQLVSAGTQLWHVGYPNGAVRRITNDLNAYGTSSLGLTADSKTLVTIQADKSAQIWVVSPGADASRAKQITSGKNDGETLAWTTDGKILYTTPSGEQSDIWSAAADGTTKKQLTLDANIERLGCASPDGGHIVFSSNRSGNFNLWRIDAGATDQKQLTQGVEIDSQAVCSPDGQWVVFRSFRQGKSTFWKIPLMGGNPEQVSDTSSTWAAVSPDGKMLALYEASAHRIIVIPFGGGAPVATLEVSINSRDAGLGWTSDGKAIAYAASAADADNIWSIPLDGGPAKQLTNFTSGLIFAFQMSHDGKQIALSRGSQIDDVILLRDGE